MLDQPAAKRPRLSPPPSTTDSSNHLENEEEGKGLSSHIDRIAGNTKDPLPYDIIREIISHLKTDEQFETLASLAQVNRSVYDLAMPKLYETVTIKDGNQVKLAYGLSQGFNNSKSIQTNQPKLAPTPRNLNMSLVREVIFKAAPHSLAPHHFPALASAVVAAPCLGHYLECRQDLSGYERHPYASDEDDFAAKSRYVSRVQAEQGAEAREIRDFVRAFASIGASAIPFIVTIHVNDTMNPNRFMNLFPGLFWPPFRLSSSYHFLDLPLHDDAMTFQCTLTPAYCLRGVVHFAEDAHSHPTHLSKKLLTSWLSTMFAGSRNTEGRIYLSGLAPLLLSMTEFSSVSSEKGQELAAVKLFDDIAFPPEFSRWSRSQKWTYFSSRVKIVNRDYRQSLKDLTEVLFPGPSTNN